MSDDKVFIPEVVTTGGFNKEKYTNEPKVRIGCAAFGLSYFIVMAAGFAIYVWTIVIAYHAVGVVGAALSAFLPFFAQIFWAIKFWSDTGTILNPYCIVLISYSAIATLMRIGSKIFFFGRRR
ncbi:MAG: hypothetical protein NT079_06575 [Candidatus Omnitrophica bacterium]|nr:hypothetical protein [Candidatus Omnitrophota bacterium]